MAREPVARNRPLFDQLHPMVYGAAVGLVAWFALAAWILFDRQNDIGLPLAMVSVLLLVAVLLPWSLSLVWRRHQMPRQRPPGKTSFHDWRMGDFAVWEEWLNLIVGLWALVSPWVLGFQGTTAMTVHVLIGAAVAVLAAIEIWLMTQNPPRLTTGR